MLNHWTQDYRCLHTLPHCLNHCSIAHQPTSLLAFAFDAVTVTVPVISPLSPSRPVGDWDEPS